jgi:hypothetical protein
MNKFKEKIDGLLQKKILRSYALYGLPTPYLKSLLSQSIQAWISGRGIAFILYYLFP